MIDLMPLARFMFDRQCDSYDADEDEREHAWRAPHIQEFWLAEAAAVKGFLIPEGAVVMYLGPIDDLDYSGYSPHDDDDDPLSFIKEEDDGT